MAHYEIFGQICFNLFYKKWPIMKFLAKFVLICFI